MGLPGKSGGVVFSPVPTEVVCYEPERVGVAFLREAMAGPMPIKVDLLQVCQAAESLDQLLDKALGYVEDVLVTGRGGGEDELFQLTVLPPCRLATRVRMRRQVAS